MGWESVKVWLLREGTFSPHPRVRGSLASQLSWAELPRAPQMPTWCPARAPRGWGKGWRQPSAGGTQLLGGAPQQPGSRGPAAVGGPQGGQGGTDAGRGAPCAGHDAPIHGYKCRSAPCGPQHPMREKQKGGGQHGQSCPERGSKVWGSSHTGPTSPPNLCPAVSALKICAFLRPPPQTLNRQRWRTQ